jgi:acyl-coenzyme A thioesterase PaaI-like protein
MALEMPERHPLAPKPGEEIPSHLNMCFGCGVDHPTGLHMKSIAGPGLTATCEFVVTEMHQGAPGLAHGGLLSLAFDEALGKLMYLLQVPAVTGHLETDFLKPIPVGSKLFIEARITGQERRKVFTEAEGRLNSPDGLLALKASALFIIVGIEHFINNSAPGFIDVESHQKRFGINP